MAGVYRGPLRNEPLAIELHNTLFAGQGEPFDGLAEPASAASWLHGVRDRLPTSGTGRDPSPDELVALRHVVRKALHAAIENRAPSRATVDALNQASARAPHSTAARWRQSVLPERTIRYHSTRRSDIVVSAIAANAIELITGPSRDELKACGTPGCVLVFLKQHPRQEWCSDACGNRARQARHYRRVHGLQTDT